MSEIRQDKTPLTTSIMMFDKTTKMLLGTKLVYKSISYIMEELLAKYENDPLFDLKSKSHNLLEIASLWVAMYDQ